jgi:endogenous inhibitor of DNA gyrase (YacG/DUF329 family)
MKCEICGREFKNFKTLARHLRTHKITSKNYYDKYLKKEGEGICPICGKETNYINLNKGYRKFCSKKCAKSGENHPLYGKHRSEETKKKISDAHKGENNPFYGKHHTKETKKKISEANKGEKNPNYGKHPSDETRKKMSDANKGENSSNYGNHRSEETKKKISEGNKGEKNGNFKGGVSIRQFEEAFGISLEEWKKLAQEIRKRDNFICQFCGKKNATDVHHIIPRRIKIDNSPDNLITLCRSCHAKIEHLTDKYLAEGKDPKEIFYKK